MLKIDNSPAKACDVLKSACVVVRYSHDSCNPRKVIDKNQSNSDAILWDCLSKLASAV
eukprot:m.121738 g.121738  ORF g.121738 m.121738 type:complete len:58 (+) comp14404_c1_seq4:77-250(+)